MKYEIKKYSLVFCGLIAGSNALAADEGLENLSDKQRIQRLERMLDSDVLREQRETMMSLREETAALREQIEQQEYELESMKQRQRNLYLDMDRRINSVEAGGRSATKMAVPVPPPNTSAGKQATDDKTVFIYLVFHYYHVHYLRLL